MGNDDAASVAHKVVQSPLDDGFGFRVQGAGGFIEDEQGWVLEYGSGDGDALFLAAREFDPPRSPTIVS
jgi:hypothetical protein